MSDRLYDNRGASHNCIPGGEAYEYLDRPAYDYGPDKAKKMKPNRGAKKVKVKNG